MGCDGVVSGEVCTAQYWWAGRVRSVAPCSAAMLLGEEDGWIMGERTSQQLGSSGTGLSLFSPCPQRQ
jgi:hypothetical protein